ncbi:hypothetical protein FHS95_002313 [Sphingomonas naasensis]|uniref:Uncharacterized protein n=1 Tax=Sphingomonas naasensis TaxID=1344951 RepID=A0A4S1WN16_9SPHN|nr:hypothetical protein [Sphingomonas naasensis]NIJ20621.1 hypothetical protein [Sphingomonas naasensis]TGX44698.1 hypothetical protein E5A74_08035 [Sphingomonas naasensis]
MTKLLIAAVAATIAFVAPATAKERVFTHEGITYSYTATPSANGVVLEGQASKGGKFRLVVKGDWVNGYAGGARVSFRAPKREATVQVAQR